MSTVEYLIYYLAVNDADKALVNLLWVYDHKPTNIDKLNINEQLSKIDIITNTRMINKMSIMDNPYVRDLLIANNERIKHKDLYNIYKLVNEILFIINKYHDGFITIEYLISNYNELCQRYSKVIFLSLDSVESAESILLHNTTSLYKKILNDIG